jgi:AraC-like DNA-binding protein
MAKALAPTPATSPKPRIVTLEEVCAGAALEQLTPLPKVAWDELALATCRKLSAQYVGASDGRVPNHIFDVPKWVFLEYLAETGRFVFHGSKETDLSELRPRVAGDNLVGTIRPRVYASSSSLLAIFSAILDRRRRRTPGGPGVSSVFNVPIGGNAGHWRHRAHIAVDHRLLPGAPWTTGCVYVLPIGAFTADYQGIRWFSERPVRPLATIRFAPHEWPLLDRVRGVNLAASVARFNDNGVGFPWWGDSAMFPNREDRPYIRRAQAILDEHFEEKISLTELAELAGVSPYHLQRTFLAATGLSPLHYQINLRVARARSLLCSGRSIADSAAEVGFGDQSQLTRHFQRILGIPPGRFASDRKNRQDGVLQLRDNWHRGSERTDCHAGVPGDGRPVNSEPTQ